jgi:hypothetical protein
MFNSPTSKKKNRDLLLDDIQDVFQKTVAVLGPAAMEDISQTTDARGFLYLRTEGYLSTVIDCLAG